MDWVGCLPVWCGCEQARMLGGCVSAFLLCRFALSLGVVVCCIGLDTRVLVIISVLGSGHPADNHVNVME